jgi:DNA-binding transcriptional LysR family regulator
MSLPSNQIDAFLAVSRTLSFSRAGEALHVTQSALSQRIGKLEEELQTSLFVRLPGGVKLTDAGARFLRFCQTRESLESEFLHEFLGGASDEKRGGIIRIAGYSSVMRSVILPALKPILLANPAVQLEFLVRETSEIPGILHRGEADYAVLDKELDRAGVEKVFLGEELLVLAENSRHKERHQMILDHDPDDSTSETFLGRAGQVPSLKRCFMDDVYGILDGVEAGLGKAVVSRHLLGDYPGIRIAKGHKPLSVSVVLHFNTQPFYTKLHASVVKALQQNCAKLLQ